MNSDTKPKTTVLSTFTGFCVKSIHNYLEIPLTERQKFTDYIIPAQR